MNFCPNLNATTQIFGERYGRWNASLSNLQSCGDTTYLRPSAGGALPPYVFIIIEFLVHVPTCFLRFAKNKKVQTWSIFLAGFNIAVATLSYASTRLVPNQVTTWQPLVLTLDFGAMLYTVILILKEIKWHGFSRQIRDWLWKPVSVLSNTRTNDPEAAYEMPSRTVPSTDPDAEEGPGKVQSLATAAQSQAIATQSHNKIAMKTLSAAIAIFWLSYILILQVVGLAFAVEGSKVRNVMAAWCSPDFQPGAVAIVDGNCNTRRIVESHNPNIGCVELPATQQATWLTNTVIILSLSLALQFVDAIIMKLSHWYPGSCLQMINPERPWFTTIAGLFIYVVLASGGVELANHLPDGITERVLVLRYESSLDVFTVCESKMVSPGLRGAVIGYTDGLFNSWGPAFFGHNTTAVGAIATRTIHNLIWVDH
jgi:hypothetical protein